MSVRKEAWMKSIEDNFYSEWGILNKLGKDDSIYSDNKTVHIPNAGAVSDVLVDNVNYPVAVTERNDEVVSYDMTSFQMKPIRVGKYDVDALTYAKSTSVIHDLTNGLGERVAKGLIQSWYIGKVTGKHVVTSGALEAADAPGATGTRKAITTADVTKAAKILDKQNVPVSGRILLLNPTMFYQLHDSVIEKFDINDNDGLMMFNKPFLGFQVVMSNLLPHAETTGAIRAVDHAGAATDIAVGYAYQKDQVSMAKGQTTVYDNSDRAEYYGDILSAETWAAGKYRRFDKKGIVPILQTA